MLKVEKTETYGWEAAIRGMRNPMNSWDASDSYNAYLFEDDFQEDKENGIIGPNCQWKPFEVTAGCTYRIGSNDLDLMKRLRNAGTDHRKFMRTIVVYCDITAPLYWWKEFDTYKVGTVANSCSTMHKIQAKEIMLDDFSYEHLIDNEDLAAYGTEWITPLDNLMITISSLNGAREKYLETKNKKYWWQMIQLLPSSYNQKRTVMLNYEVLVNMYKSRKRHKLDEWRTFCDWIETLPYFELITDERNNFADYADAEEHK